MSSMGPMSQPVFTAAGDGCPGDHNAGPDAEIALEAMREVLRVQGRLVVKPEGGSMGRRYRAAETVVIEPMPARPLPVGSIIVFPRRDCWVAHRVLRRLPDPGGVRYLTCGDAARNLDNDLVTHRTAIGFVTEVRYPSRSVSLRSRRQRTIALIHAARSMLAAFSQLSSIGVL